MACSGVLLIASPVFGEGLAEVFSPGGESCQPSDADLDAVPTPAEPASANVRSVDPVYLDGPDALAPVPIIPIDMDPSGYFSFNKQLTVLVGVSADIACHLHLGSGSDICTFDSSKPSFYKNVLADAASKGLNKIRLVVAINGAEPDPAPGICSKSVHPDDQPFVYVKGTGSSPGYWRLDQRNAQFFRNLRTVVQFAASQKMFVEVSFFAPWFGVWEKGPWHPNYGRIGNNLDRVGFTNRSQFHTIPASGDTTQLAKLREVQKNVIRWTIDALWDQPRVYWEIANEPENPNPTATADCDPGNPPAVDAAATKSWQEMMINEVVAWEAQYVRPNTARKLNKPHLIGVQPFSVAGRDHYVSNPNVSIINGHYTRVFKGKADLGAIDLVRSTQKSGRIRGFNEGKISGITGSAGTAEDGKPESARAEAWEFGLNRGATYDHFGYFYLSPNGIAVRRQLGKLREFLMNLPLNQLAAAPDTEGQPTWIDLQRYGDSRKDPIFKYWAALEPKPNATGVLTYVAYIHHSKSRQLSFDGYAPIIKSSTPYYSASESYKLCLGPGSGTYEVDWICPENNQRTGGQTIQWTGSTTCSHGGPGSVTVQPSTWGGGTAAGCDYTYDIVLRIRKTK